MNDPEEKTVPLGSDLPWQPDGGGLQEGPGPGQHSLWSCAAAHCPSPETLSPPGSQTFYPKNFPGREGKKAACLPFPMRLRSQGLT
jgi:hypothetical protein